MQQALNRSLREDFPLLSPFPTPQLYEEWVYMHSPSEEAGHSALQHDWGLHELDPKAIAEIPGHHAENFLDTAEHSLIRYSMQGNKSAQAVVSSWLWRQTIIKRDTKSQGCLKKTREKQTKPEKYPDARNSVNSKVLILTSYLWHWPGMLMTRKLV